MIGGGGDGGLTGVTISVTRLGIFYKFLALNFLKKFAKYPVIYLAITKKISPNCLGHQLLENLGYFWKYWVNFGENLATFDSNIWSR